VKIINARVVGYKEKQEIGIDERGIITAIAPSIAEEGKILDVEGDVISLGGIDLQINGGLGLAFPEIRSGDIEKLGEISDYLWREGVDGYLPTLVTCAIENFHRALGVIDEFMKLQEEENKNTARVLGVHLEGPFLNPEKRGAHPQHYLLRPGIEILKDIWGDYGHRVKIITLAPELDIDGEVIKYLHQRGIIVSLGHSTATAAQAKKAFEWGASMVTHAYNAMPPLHHRQPGLLGEAILNDKVYCGLIADGKHVAPQMMKLLLKGSDYDKGVFLVSDALAPIGLGDGLYPWDDREIEVIDGTAKLLNGTLAGTTLPLSQGVENLVKWGVCGLETAVALATESPRAALNMPAMGIDRKANLLRWQWDEKTGKLIWQRLVVSGY
jgi:N-acetylglucosamine-6-phosphate deacetylase